MSRFTFKAKVDPAVQAAALEAFGLEAIRAEDRILDYEMPHHGPASSERCQQVETAVHFAPGEAHWRSWRHDCRDYTCGVCKSEKTPKGYDIRGWEGREGAAIEDRLAHFQESTKLSDFPTHFYSGTKVRRHRHRRKAHVYHVVASPPQAWAKEQMWSRQGYKALWGRLYRVAASRGILGGVAIFHPQRIPSKWNQRTCGAVGPHFHVLGITKWGDAWDGQVCSILMQGGELRDHSALKARLMSLGMATRKTQAIAGDGWVVKVLPKRQSVANTAAYVLSHAGRPLVAAQCVLDERTEKCKTHRKAWSKCEAAQGRRSAYPALPQGSGRDIRQTTRVLGVVPHWFGALSYNKLKVPESTETGIKCPVCQVAVPKDDWHVVEWADPDGLPPPVGGFGRTTVDAWDLAAHLRESNAHTPWAREAAHEREERFNWARRGGA